MILKMVLVFLFGIFLILYAKRPANLSFKEIFLEKLTGMYVLKAHIVNVAITIKKGNRNVCPLKDLKGILMMLIKEVKCSIKALIGLIKRRARINESETLSRPSRRLSVTYIIVMSSLLAPKHKRIADSFMSSLYEANEIMPIIIVTPINAMARKTSIPTLAASTKEKSVSSIVKALEVIA